MADRRPFVLDVDSGSVTAVGDVPEVRPGVVRVVPVGGRGAAIVAHRAGGARVYGLSPRSEAAVDLGAGRNAVADATRDAVWIQAPAGGGRCTIRGVALDGRTTVRRRPFRCAARLDPGGRRGIVVNRTVLYDPVTDRVVLRAPAGVLAAAGTTLVLARPGRRISLFEAATRRERRLRWPSVLAAADQPAADPQGRFVALGFADPSWVGTGRQVLDVWVLDVRTRALAHLPGMPAFVALKYTSMSWTDDGRLVLLARSAGREVVAVWRPGQRRLATKVVRLPARTGGSDSFATVR